MVASGYRRLSDLPAMLPIFPLDGALLLPGGALPLQIFEPRYLNMVDDVMAGGRLIGMIQTAPGGDRRRPHLAQVGCAGRATSYAETGDGKYLITLTGICRFRVGEEVLVETPYRQIRPEFGPYAGDLEDDDTALEFERAPFLSILRRYLDRRGLGIEWEAVNVAPAAPLINSLSMALPFEPLEKQALLEAAGVEERREALAALLAMNAALPLNDDDEPSSLQ
ncbi:MAG TPA: LON peptidase substrate-binding domain-containing protein [Caulobacteraceae bacterium]|nr:LON peptidase substrate-binding domain-containing protein [Caulobacteraceae bacterium]